MKFFVEYNLDEKIPANVQEVFSKVKEISNISLDIGYYSDEYFTAWVHFGLESNKEAMLFLCCSPLERKRTDSQSLLLTVYILNFIGNLKSAAKDCAQ